MNQLSHRHNVLILSGLSFLAAIITVWGYLIWNPPEPKATLPAGDEKLTLTAPIIGGSDPMRGLRSADIIVVEFGDFLCPACAKDHVALKKIIDANPRVQLIWKDMPNVAAHPLSRDAAIAARCAAMQNKFWTYADLLMKNQDDLLDGNALKTQATAAGLNMQAFTQCQSSTTAAQAVDLTIAEGLALGVDATPYFFIGADRGSFDADAVESKIKTILKQSK